MWGYATVAQAAPSAELEVVGQLTVHTEAEPTDEGQQIIRGRMNDEVGAPVGGTISVQTQTGHPANVQLCPWLSADTVPSPRRQLDAPGTVPVGADGSFCFVAEEQKGLVLEAQAEHFLKAVHDLDLGLQRALSRPRFVQAPATIDLHLEESHVVQILARSERRPPEGTRLMLNLECAAPHALGESSLKESRMQRFEFRAPAGVGPGNCKLVATVTAKKHKPLSATRSVLLRDRIRLSLTNEINESEVFTLGVKAEGIAGATQKPLLDEGLVEARQDGAFVGLGPVHDGVATLEFEATETPRVIQLTYVPASSAYLPGEPILMTVPAHTSGFRWAGVHTIGLVAFCFWLSYAWLRPPHGKDPKSASATAPPKRALLRESGKKTGPIKGRVLDAHTGEPLFGMQVELTVVGPEENRVLEQASTDNTGTFALETHLESHPLLTLTVQGDRYMSLSSPTRGTELTVHLTERRRALVHGLVTWARKAGRPWDRNPAPTPRSVEKTALERGDPTRAEWARRVSEAAYGPKPLSEAATRSLKVPDSALPATPSTPPRR